jgi:hypothetical protein
VSAGLPSATSQLIEYHLAQLHARLLFGKGPPRRIHRENLTKYRMRVNGLVTHRTCFTCLLRPPQHALSCGHAYCDVCAAGYGRPVDGAEYQYLVDHCVLCQSSCNNLIKLLPPTAAVRAISIDGGGVRGFIPLRFLVHMQQILGPECPLQDLFDVAFGTSSGKNFLLHDLALGLTRRPNQGDSPC